MDSKFPATGYKQPWENANVCLGLVMPVYASVFVSATRVQHHKNAGKQINKNT